MDDETAADASHDPLARATDLAVTLACIMASLGLGALVGFVAVRVLIAVRGWLVPSA